MSAITINGVSKVFAKHGEPPALVLRDISLEVADGEFVVLLGPSGCGKTTLLRIMGHLERPTSGEVVIASQNEKAGAIGFVFQDATLMPWRSAAENIALPLELARVPKKERLERVREVLELVDLSQAARKFPKELSGGMRQRISIARALVHDPQILLMDEPFGALDAQTRDMMNIELQRVWLRYKKTVVFVTHSVAEAIFLADRIVMFGANPGYVHSITTVNLPRPRTMAMNESDEFRRVAADLREQLGQVKRPAPLNVTA